MSLRLKYLPSTLLAVVLFSSFALSGCAEHSYYRVYDPAHADYHRWDHHEDVYYQRWETETHRDHQEFNKRRPDEQKEYWDWRHSHPDDKR